MTWDEIDAAMTEADRPVQPVQPDVPVSSRGSEETGKHVRVLANVRAWFARYVSTVQESDLDLLTLWAAHTHLCLETYTTPRLLLDSPVPGSGKTTTLEHLERLCLHPVQMASLSSPAMLTRMLDAGLRTVLVDEADRSLSPDKKDIGDLLAVLNSGYKRGGTRPVLVPVKDGWRVKEMPTFSPVAMAGNSPNLPEDTRSRSLRVLLMPDIEGAIDESDWEWIDTDARQLGKELATWADTVRDDVRLNRPDLPEEVRGRARERWAPLKRVADAAGGRWPAVVDRLALEDIEEQNLAREEGAVIERPHVVLMQHIAQVWPGELFVPTENLIDRLVASHPETWGEFSPFGKRLTAQRLGRMLSGNYKIHTSRPDGNGPRGYTLASLTPALRRFGLVPTQPVPRTDTGILLREGSEPVSQTLPINPAQAAEPAEPACERDGCDRPNPDHQTRAYCPTCWGAIHERTA